MKIVSPSFEILTPLDDGAGMKFLTAIEKAGRTCYKSEERMTNESCLTFCKGLIKAGHEAMVEHAPSLSVKFICNRGVTHELVRHRLSSFAQESTRYCNYSKEKHGSGITVIEPHDFEEWSADSQAQWKLSVKEASINYLRLIATGLTAQRARGVLPIDVKTEIIVSANVRQWRTILKLRTAEAAHPDIRYLMRGLLRKLKIKIPILFDDII